MSRNSVPQECPTRVSHKSFLQHLEYKTWSVRIWGWVLTHHVATIVHDHRSRPCGEQGTVNDRQAGDLSERSEAAPDLPWFFRGFLFQARKGSKEKYDRTKSPSTVHLDEQTVGRGRQRDVHETVTCGG